MWFQLLVNMQCTVIKKRLRDQQLFSLTMHYQDIYYELLALLILISFKMLLYYIEQTGIHTVCVTEGSHLTLQPSETLLVR